jgi:acetyl esterase/lipase
MSRRLRLLNAALRTVAKPLLRRTKTPEQAARDFDIAARILFPAPAGTSTTTRHVPGPAGPVPLVRIDCGATTGDGAILYFHGGGYVAGSPRTHRAMMARLSARSGLPVFAPDYRLAPAATAPAAFEDACAAWNALVSDGLPPGRIVLGGDSAGGGLALALLAELCAKGAPPAGLFAFSPWTDLALTGASLDTNAETDAILPRSRVEELVEIVLGAVDPRDPRCSPLYATFLGAPPILFHASATEILLDDTRRMAALLETQGASVTTRIWSDAPHVWHLFDGWLPEAREALEEAAAFAAGCLKERPRQGGS